MKLTPFTETRLARWSRTLAFFFAQLLLLAVVLYRFEFLSADVAFPLVSLAYLGGALALGLAIGTFVQVWRHGVSGAGKAVVALGIVALMFALPSWYVPRLFVLPSLSDVTTDTEAPPAFQQLAQLRTLSAHPANYPSPTKATEQKAAYPDLVPLTLDRSKQDAFDLVRESARKLGWTIVREQPPGKGSDEGILEAVDKTLIMGLPHDVVVRVRGDDKQARIDARSASRYGKHDLGDNAKRIRRLFQEITDKLARIEAMKAEQLAREKRRRAREAERARQERAKRLERLRALRRERARRAAARKKRLKRQRKRKFDWSPFQDLR